jgi:MFS family permease
MEGAPPPVPGSRSPFLALRHRNFRLWFGGQLTSLVGTWMQTIAQNWLVYRVLGGTARELGLVNFVGAVPLVPLTLHAGAVADRFPRRWIVFWMQAVMMLLAFVLSYLCWTGHVRLWHVLALATLLGAAQAIDTPARQAFVVELSGKTDMANAIALNAGIFHGARVLGPAAAGILVAAVGIPAAFLVNGLSFLAVLAGLLLMDASALHRTEHRGDGELLGGVRYLARDRHARGLFLLIFWSALLTMPYHVLVPIYAREVFGGEAGTYGILMSAAGAGAVAGSLVVATGYSTARKERVLVVGTVMAPLCLLAFSFCRAWWLALAILPLLGFALVLQSAPANAILQTAVPDGLRGRVMALYVSLFLGMMRAGALLLGYLASAFTAPAALLVTSLLALAASALVYRRYPELLRPVEWGVTEAHRP